MKDHKWVGLAILTVGTFGLIGLSIYLFIARRLNPITLKTLSISRRDGEAMNYIVSYLLPFIALPSEDIANMISLAVFLFFLGVIYINSGMIHINPILNLAGWHIYEATLENGNTCALLMRHPKRKEIKAVKMDEDIYIEAKL